MRFGPHELVLSNEQDLGQRTRQEDYFGFWTQEDPQAGVREALIVVADGMGGLEGGDAASVIAVDAFVARMAEADPERSIAERFELAAREANARVFAAAQESGANVGSTLVALYLTPERYQWISIGDSVLYRVRDGRLERLNRDHNLRERLADQIARGEVSEAQAAEREAEHAHLTSNLGLEEIPEIDLTEPASLRAGDRFVLASDGLSDSVALERIEQLVAGTEAESVAGQLVAETLAAGNPQQDNVTVCACSIEGRAFTAGAGPTSGASGEGASGGGGRALPILLGLALIAVVVALGAGALTYSGGGDSAPADVATASASQELTAIDMPAPDAGPAQDAASADLGSAGSAGEGP